MANAKVDVVGQDDIPVVVELYNRIYRPTHDVQFFRRRFLGRYNVLMLVATLDEAPVGFFIGFELKPTVFFAWLYGVMPDVRRQGIASQLMDAAHCVGAGPSVSDDPLRVPQPAPAHAAIGHQPRVRHPGHPLGPGPGREPGDFREDSVARRRERGMTKAMNPKSQIQNPKF